MPGPVNENSAQPQVSFQKDSPWDFLKKLVKPASATQKTPPTPAQISRRQFLQFAPLAAAGSLIAAKKAYDNLSPVFSEPHSSAPAGTHPTPEKLPSPTPQPIIEKTPSSPSPALTLESEIKSNKPQLFTDPETNELAQQLGITWEKFFDTYEDTDKVLNQLKAFQGDNLYPIFPPSVIEQWKKLLYRLSDEVYSYNYHYEIDKEDNNGKKIVLSYADRFKISPNILATLMTIESGGIATSVSGKHAQGLFQVMPERFPETVRQNFQQMQEPGYNGTVGIDYFANDCLSIARREISKDGTSRDNAQVMAKAMAAYNGGPNRITEEPQGFPDDETRYYRDHCIRFMLLMEISHNLQQKHPEYTDSQVIQKLQASNDYKARCYALERSAIRHQDTWNYAFYTDVLKLLQNPTLTAENLLNDYNDYLANKIPPRVANGYQMPINPALAIWMALGGRGLTTSSAENETPTAWLAMATNR